ncbi:MAG: sugar porter family MFS transporter [Acidobacteriota bacterium]|nr:sugar porter family MFS transporter [Acidobacteriota bacterium]
MNRPRSTSGFAYRIASVAALGGLLFGFDTAIINGAIVFLKREFRWSDFQTEVAASSLLVGCVAGSSIAGWLSDRLGRKRVLLLSAAIFAVSSLVTAIANNLAQFSMARIVAGTAIGIASMLAPLYIAEISPEAIRGRLVSLNQLAIVLGILVSYLTGWALSFAGGESWRWMFASVAIPSLLFFFALFAVPESPRWLVKNGETQQAVQILARLHQPPSQVDEMKRALAEEANANLLQRRLRKPLLIGIVLAILQQITGINTILYYGSVIFTEHAGAHNASAALWANVIIGVVNLVFTVVALLFIDRIGRKPLLMLASAGMAISLAILVYLFSIPHVFGSAILALILCYVAFFSVGLGPGVWVVISELFPTKVRGQAMSVATISLWMACLLVTSTFLSLIRVIGIRGAFGLYAVLCVFTFIFVWRVIPETKGQTLESIERQWASES